MLRTVLRPAEDAFGHLLTDLLAGCRVVEVVERDDGCVFTGEPDYYLAPFRLWWSQERRAMRFVRGQVLDVGCGAGRVGLHLQSRAIRAGERFDTILLLGNNLGLLAGERQGRRLLRKLARAATDRGRILAGSYDPYDGASELARGYHARNRARGRMGGIERLRVRYRQYATPWYDVLFASRERPTAADAIARIPVRATITPTVGGDFRVRPTRESGWRAIAFASCIRVASTGATVERKG